MAECDFSNYDAAKALYDQSMSELKTACDNKDAADQALADAQQAASDADAAYTSAQDTATARQATMVAEAELVGVDCACPPPPDPFDLDAQRRARG
jgi:hypothetical protein